jgi:hypothetical protein
MKTTQLFLSLAALCGTALVANADSHLGISLHIGIPAPVVVREAPPPRRVIVERHAPAPAQGYVWVEGHYVWEGRWTWVEGAWVQPPQPGAYWVDGRWDGPSQQWVEGHWEVQQASMPPPPPPPPGPPGAVASAEFYVNDAPPPPRREVIVERDRPGRDYVWVAGYWGVRGGRRDWIPGHWERPPHPHMTWVEPRWEHRDRGYVFVEGRWK